MTTMEPGKYYLARFVGWDQGKSDTEAPWPVAQPVVCRKRWQDERDKATMGWRIWALKHDESFDYSGWSPGTLLEVEREITEEEARQIARDLMAARRRRHEAIQEFTRQYDERNPA